MFIALPELSRDAEAWMRRRGFRLVTRRRLRASADGRPVAGLTAAIAGLFRHAPVWMLETAVLALREVSIWSGFLDHWGLEHFVTYCDYTGQQVARSLVLRKRGVRTWYYMDTSNHYHAFCGDSRPAYRVAFWGFLLYDVYLTWNSLNTAYMRTHAQKIGRYVEVGVLWSEAVRTLREGTLASAAFDALRNELRQVRASGRRIVGVFDSSYNGETITGFRQGLAFAWDIGRLLEEMDDVVIVFKEKTNPRTYRDLGWDTLGLEREYAKLAAHPRCLMTGSRVSRAAIIALADLTISFPFTSTTLEAIGAGRKAIYYDPLNSYPKTFYDAIPGFVLHDFANLKARVGELLYRTDEAAYLAYLERHARERVDPFLDGRALSRFRDLLCGKAGAAEGAG